MLENLICDIDSKYIYDKQAFAHGGNADVYKGLSKDEGNKDPVAVKKLRNTFFDFKQKKNFWREVEILASINHPFCLEILNFSIDPPIIVTPFMDGGTLDDFLKKKDPTFDTTKQMCTLYAICSTMSAIHSIHIIHRDFKPENIFMKKNGDFYDIKIADFGSARKIDNNTKITLNPNTTPKYTAPEVFEGEEYTSAIDVYSFGIIYYQFFKYEIEFENGRRPTTLYAFSNLILTNTKFVRPPEMNDDQLFFFEQCTSRNELDRPPFQNLAIMLEKNKSLWFPNVDETKYLNYVEKCKKIYQDFITANQHTTSFIGITPGSPQPSLNLTQSLRIRRTQSSLQKSIQRTTSNSIRPSIKKTRSCHIDYLSPEE